MICDLKYSTVICYEVRKFPVIDTFVFCVPLSYHSFFMISDVTYFTVICYKVGTFPQWFQCAFELSFFIMMSDITYSTVICYEACKF